MIEGLRRDTQGTQQRHFHTLFNVQAAYLPIRVVPIWASCAIYLSLRLVTRSTLTCRLSVPASSSVRLEHESSAELLPFRVTSYVFVSWSAGRVSSVGLYSRELTKGTFSKVGSSSSSGGRSEFNLQRHQAVAAAELPTCRLFSRHELKHRCEGTEAALAVA